MKYVCLLLFALLIQGCATKLELTSRQKEILANLTDSEAEKITKNIFSRTEKHFGLIGSNHTQIQALTKLELVGIESCIITYTDYAEHISNVNTKSNMFSGNNIQVNTTISYDYTREKYTLDLRNIKKLRLEDFPPPLCPVDKQLLTAYYSFSKYVSLHISKDEVDETIALIKFYSPGARIIFGNGF